MKTLKMNKDIFIRLDADDIGNAIELALINNDIESATLIHQKVQEGIKIIENELVENVDCKILLKGCDDILFQIKNEHFSESLLIRIKKMFQEHSGFTISIGIAYSLQHALLNLRKAKLSGKNIIISDIK